MARGNRWLAFVVFTAAMLIMPMAGAQEGGTAFDDDRDTTFDAPPADQTPDRQDMGSADEGLHPGEKPQGSQSNLKIERFKDWAVRCGEVGDSQSKKCEMFQTVTRSETDEVVMRVVIGFPPNTEQPAAIFELPLGILLPKGAQLSIDGGEPMRFPIQICVDQGCRANIRLPSDLLEKMRSGAKGKVTVKDPRGRGFDIPISLMGFTAAIERISS